MSDFGSVFDPMCQEGDGECSSEDCCQDCGNCGDRDCAKCTGLVQVGWYCWRGGCEHADGHLAAMACRPDSVPIYVPKEWEKDMRKVMDE